MDFYDPHQDEYLMAELVFKSLFNLREQLGRRIDSSVSLIVSDEALLTYSRAVVSGNFLENHLIGGEYH